MFPKDISEHELMDFAAYFGISEPIQQDSSGKPTIKATLENGDTVQFSIPDSNRFLYKVSNSNRGKMLQSDAELEQEAKRIFSELSFIQGDYEFVGAYFG